MSDGNNPAYPTTLDSTDFAGMTKREAYAAQALIGMIRSSLHTLPAHDQAARWCFDQADAMIAAAAVPAGSQSQTTAESTELYDSLLALISEIDTNLPSSIGGGALNVHVTVDRCRLALTAWAASQT